MQKGREIFLFFPAEQKLVLKMNVLLTLLDKNYTIQGKGAKTLLGWSPAVLQQEGG